MEKIDRKHWTSLALAGGVLVFGGIVSWLFLFGLMAKAKSILFSSEQEIIPTVENVEKALTKNRRLDGRIVATEDADFLPIGVMIENLPSVRPQAGLSRASVVYEALVEGFSTRFLALFDPKEFPDRIGPIRSSRQYYLEWISEYNGVYVHAGGSPESLKSIDAFGIRDLNALRRGPYFWRDRSRSAPHNLYSSRELLDRAMRDLGYGELRAEFEPWLFQDDRSLEERPENAKKVIIKFSGRSYETEYRYDRESDEYIRYNAGTVHGDENSKDEIRAKNVVVVEIPPVVSIGEKGRLALNVVGEGRVLIARGGEVIEGKWKKKDRTSRTRFYDAADQEIKFGRGSTWIHILPSTQEFQVVE